MVLGVYFAVKARLSNIIVGLAHFELLLFGYLTEGLIPVPTK
jgi:hypothetical protein